MDTMSNAIGARINELLTGFYIYNRRWYDTFAEQKLKVDRKLVTSNEYLVQDGRAVAMAKAFINEARRYKYEGVVSVTWTARPGALQRIVDPKNKLGIMSRNNPSDLVVKFAKVPYGASKFLGLSAKSTTGRNKAGIGFKNPGMGKIEKDLDIDLHSILERGVSGIRKDYKLSEQATKRRVEINRSVRVKKAVDEEGDTVLEKIRNKLYARIKAMSDDDLRIYLLKEWLDADELYPAYFKVTGQGNKSPYKAKVEDPRSNDKLEAINTQKLRVYKAGAHSIQVRAGSIKLFNIRAKFDKQKLAGSVVFSADPL